jgi:mono/diheme cytochrome c family protein
VGRRWFFVVAALLVATGAERAMAEPSLQTAQTSPAELDYLQYCSGCHQSDGSGSAGNHIPRLPGSVGHFTRSAEGRAFLIQVGGVAQSPISDARVAALLNWMLPAFDRADLPADFAPYSAAEVASARATRPGDLMALRMRVARDLAARGMEVAKY